MKLLHSSSYLVGNSLKIHFRLMRKEGIFCVGDNHFKKLFYCPEKITPKWSWKNSFVKKWYKWAVQNRLVSEDNHSPFPKMKVIYYHRFVTSSSILKLKFYFPSHVKVTFDEKEASIWELSLLKKPHLKALV
jgi:hypothetical protein